MHFLERFDENFGTKEFHFLLTYVTASQEAKEFLKWCSKFSLEFDFLITEIIPQDWIRTVSVSALSFFSWWQFSFQFLKCPILLIMAFLIIFWPFLKNFSGFGVVFSNFLSKNENKCEMNLKKLKSWNLNQKFRFLMHRIWDKCPQSKLTFDTHYTHSRQVMNTQRRGGCGKFSFKSCLQVTEHNEKRVSLWHINSKLFSTHIIAVEKCKYVISRESKVNHKHTFKSQ